MKKRVKRIVPLFLTLMMLIGLVPAPSAKAAGGAENAAISSTKSENDFVLADSGTVATIWVDADEEQPVQRVAKDLKSDVIKVTGQTPEISPAETRPEGPVVIVGTLDKSSQIQGLVNDGTITEEEKAAIEGEWEAYLIKVVDKDTLVIAGSDNRGAIYGVYKISEEMGVSPWHYFADVPVQTKEAAYVPAGTVLIDKPDVQYRGLFINDEEKLYQWVQEAGGLDKGQDGTYQFGPEFYSKLFELILRLGGNYFWPAMHMVGFNNTQANIPVLQEYGVVFGTSHCDMLGRTNKHEWNSWCAEKGYNLTLKDWDYTVHKDKMIEYWTEGVTRHKDSDVQWTVGLRGNSDEPMIAENIEAYMTEEEKANPSDAQSIENAKTRILIDAMKEQYKILQSVLGVEEAEKAFKVFVPYKEVLPLYNNQIFQDFLKSGECFEFTTMWCNDNHGMVRNLPNAEERVRVGGNALYYHLSYWAPKDQSYMWMSSIPLSVMGEELNKSWESGIQKAWIVNVGDLKPAEGELDYFMRCGWDVDYTTNAIDFSTEWMMRNFGDQMSVETADEVADILNTFYHHSNVRKVEQMRLDVFEQMNFNEWDKRMATSQDLYERVAAVADSLSDAAKDSFYELVQSKINWTYYTNKMFYYADKSNLAYDQGRMASADTFSKLSIAADGERKAEIAKYSTIVDGKWDGFIDPENYDVGANFAGAPVTSQSPATSPAIVLGETEMGAIVQGEMMPTTETSMLSFSRYGQDGKFIDIFNKGAGSFEWTASTNAEWIILSATEGTVCDAVSGLTENERLVVEFSARVNKMLVDASSWVAMSSGNPTVTTMLYNKATSGVDVLLKDAANTNHVGNVATSEWHGYKIILNMATKTYDVYMDGNTVVTGYSFRDTSVSELIGHRFGINNKANTTVDFDNFQIAITQIGAIDTFAAAVARRKIEINSYSYPIGEGLGSYSQTAYDELLETIEVAETLAAGTTITQYEADTALAAIDEAYDTFKTSQVLEDDGQEYLFYRDFEGDTVGKMIMPYGMELYDNTCTNASYEIKETSGNTYLRLSTNSSTGTVQMKAPYSVKNLTGNQKLIVEFSARVVTVPGGKEVNLFANIDESQSYGQATHIVANDNKVSFKNSSGNATQIGTYVRNVWNNYRVVVDVFNQTYDVYIDGSLAKTGCTFRQNTYSLTGHRFGIKDKVSITVDFDNIKVSISEVDYLKTSQINIRDPFVLPYEGKYYMYGTRVGDVNGFDVYVSEDLETWSIGKTVFKQTEDFWGTQDYWAPEVYQYTYNGETKFYMLATFKGDGEDAHRGTAILVSDTPDGTFVEHSEDALTPSDWDCLDGTLYFEDGTPYMVFCHEWTQIGDGTVCAIQLSSDLKTTVGEAFELWSGSDASWKYDLKDAGYDIAIHEKNYVTDGPDLLLVDGELIALWSSFTKNGYVVAVSRSDNGKITGNWTVDDDLFYDKDGGHGMVFETFENQTKFVYHTPNTDRLERPCFKNIKLSDLKK